MRRLLALIGCLMLLTTVPRLAAQENDELVVRQLQFSGNDAIADDHKLELVRA
jgi:hypothetical protein